MQTTLKVPRIHCSGCVNNVTRAMQKLPGVQRVEADEVTKNVKVEFDPGQVDEQKIRATLNLIGYPAA